jgi:hypothetical protein
VHPFRSDISPIRLHSWHTHAHIVAIYPRVRMFFIIITVICTVWCLYAHRTPTGHTRKPLTKLHILHNSKARVSCQSAHRTHTRHIQDTHRTHTQQTHTGCLNVLIRNHPVKCPVCVLWAQNVSYFRVMWRTHIGRSYKCYTGHTRDVYLIALNFYIIFLWKMSNVSPSMKVSNVSPIWICPQNIVQCQSNVSPMSVQCHAQGADVVPP